MKRLVGVLLLVAPIVLLATVQPAAAVDVELRVTIDRIRALDNFGTATFPEAADFYAVVTIDGNEFDNKDSPSQDALEDRDDISPGWEFSESVDASRGSVPVTVTIYDEDGFLRTDDDRADLDPGPGDSIELTVDLTPCAVSGDLTDDCGAPLVTGGVDDDSAEITFRVSVVEPPAAPGLRVRCLHDPIWPQPGETVTITVESLDGNHAPRLADAIEIWVDDTAAPASVTPGVDTASLVVGPFAGNEFSYACRVRDDGDASVAFTGWRTVAVGSQPGPATPVLITGSTASRLDFVFVGDVDDYTGSADSALLTDVHDVIRDAYYVTQPANPGVPVIPSQFDLFLVNQDRYNFWIANGLGDAEDAGSGCDHEYPLVSFADTAVLLHQDTFRDCAPGGERVFSSEPFSLGTVLHESGHRPFGLADEYCCDGGYFETDTFPNVYAEPSGCFGDAPALGRSPADCREFIEEVPWWFDRDWSISEPTGNDLMNDRGRPQAADQRRIEAVLADCESARC